MYVRIKSGQSNPGNALDNAIRRSFAKANEPGAAAKYLEIRAGQIDRANGNALEIPDEVLVAFGQSLDADGIGKLAKSLTLDPADLQAAIETATNAEDAAPQEAGGDGTYFVGPQSGPNTGVPADPFGKKKAATVRAAAGLQGAELEEVLVGMGRMPVPDHATTYRNPQTGGYCLPTLTPTQIRAARAKGK